ncbi:molecular chaperone DnaJ [Gluconacetobacter liquefaciens]|uniref:J domain-containing protein n=2 Tax=Gluconacetobacter liquefaciens TaxID=89584 RepID=A0A7W4PBJ9_GLULI|nr:J domain-containing protein [Gluconacetobacter liquefaciens]MBB2187635.1 J domain-containing protein [Gluconacetobacter liquefaciens]GEB37482.1 molecular chaperone DnaJ [Gluconacetobacter liquefaciens]
MMTRKNTRHRAFDPDPDAPARCCDMAGCDESAGYRAPKSRDALNEYFWFCLPHVREYNARWDFYKGMSPGQIEAHIRDDVSWNRPSWRLGQRAGRLGPDDFIDPMDLMDGARRPGPRTGAPARPDMPEALRQPLDMMGLDWPLSMDELKMRYKDLARRHHPDANGGDRQSEELLKSINVAYTTLRAHLASAREADLERTA